MSADSAANSRGLIKSMLIIGSAQMVNIVNLIIRMKALAILLGPAGVGLLSIYNSLHNLVVTAAGLGMGSSGVREIAAARGEATTLSRVRRVLLAAHLLQGALAMVLVWLLREPIALLLFGNTTHATEVGLIGVAILLSLLASAQTALLQGLRRIADLSRVTIFSSFIGTIVGLGVVWFLGEHGLIWFVLVQPLIAVLIALYFTRRLPKPAVIPLSLPETWSAWLALAKLGSAFMLGGLVTTATLLLVQGQITQELGLDAAGHFAAAWGITIIYIGFLLNAMGADYYPRLTEVIHDHVAAVRLMNDQAQLSLAIGGPVLLLLIGLAPWVITLLYSAEFTPAVALLQWQALGNVFKLASWALSFSIVAAARPITFFFMEMSFNVVFLAMTLTLLPIFGLSVTAFAFVLSYIVYFLTANLLAQRIHHFRWQHLSLFLLGLHVSLATALLLLALLLPVSSAIVSVILAASTGLFGLRLVLIKIGGTGHFIERLVRFYALIGWPIKNKEGIE